MTLRLFITIESIGNGAADRLWRICDGPAPSWDTDSVYKEGLRRFPGSIAAEVNFRDGGSTIGGLTFELDANSTLRPLLYDQRREQIDTLQSALAKAATTISLGLTTLEGTTIILGHEAIHLTTHNGGGSYTCVRDVLDTVDVAHGVGERDYVSVFSAATGPVLRFRKVTFGYVNTATATGYSDEVTLWGGLLTGISAPSPELIRLDADGLLTLLSKKTINNAPWRSLPPPDGVRIPREQDNPEPTSFVGRGSPRASSPALFSVAGKCVVSAAYTAASGYTAVYTKPEDKVAESAPYPVKPDALWEVYKCDGTGSTSALPFSENLITCCLQILTTTDTAGDNGNYDTGEADLGLGVPQAWIDVSGAEQIRATLGELAVMDRLYLGFDGKPVKAMEWMQSLLHGIGVALADDDGTLRFVVLEDNSALTTTIITEADIPPPPEFPPPYQARRMDNAFDEVVVNYDFHPGYGTVTDSFEDAVQKYLNRYGDSSQLTLNLEGISSRSKAQALAILAVQTWHQEIPQIDLTVLRTKNSIGVGDLVLLTHPKIYQATGGTRSVTNQACIVVGKRLEMETATIRLRLLNVGVLYNRVGRIAPCARVEAWTLGTKTLDIKQDYSDNGFQSGDLTGYTTDAAAFSAGDKVALCNRDHSLIEDGLEIASVGSTTLVLVSAPSATPVDGNLIKFSSYNQAATQQTDSFAFIADANEVLGSGNDAGYEWTR